MIRTAIREHFANIPLMGRGLGLVWAAALDGFSLKLAPGKAAAIVGYNGSGKSTLIKLLCRFYDPQAGRITVLFQEPVHYHATAARAAGVDGIIGHLPQGYETVLGKWFGGAEFSVGEWQRLALARAILRDADIVVLDEPTSAMDSWAEAARLGRFREVTAGHTTLIITHRFTTALHADVIHVVDEGRVVESGTHAQLVAGGGSYAQSWLAQMREVGDRRKSQGKS